MEESSSTLHSKDRKHKKLWKAKKHLYNDEPVSESSKSTVDSCKSSQQKTQTKTKLGWRNLFGIFGRSSTDKTTSNVNSQYKRDFSRYVGKGGVVKEEPSDVYLSDVTDDFAMAVSLPEDVEGKDVQVSIEMKAIGEQERTKTGLRVTEGTSSKTVFTGNIKIPSNVTIEKISKMPLYFINANKSVKRDGNSCHKIETVIKPLDDNLPTNIDKTTIVSDINLKVKLQNVSKTKKWCNKRYQTLNYLFISNDLKKSRSQLRSKTSDIVEESSQEKFYNEDSKAIVREILSHVVEKIETQEMSTQYSRMITTVNREVDIQKSLLLKTSSIDYDSSKVSTDYLSRITEKDEDETRVGRATSDDTCYPKSTTHSPITTPEVTDSHGSMFYLKAPTNTPNFPQPRYMIQHDNYSGNYKTVGDIHDIPVKVLHTSRPYQLADVNYVSLTKNNIFDDNNLYKQLLRDHVKADIDKTLELLETAKNKLVNYLDASLDLAEFHRDYKCKLQADASNLRRDKYAVTVYDANKYKRYSKETKKFKEIEDKNRSRDNRRPSQSEQFFLGEAKNEDTPNPQVRTLVDTRPISTIQNIYNPVITIDGNALYRSKSQAAHDELLEKRYSGDGGQNIVLAFAIVEKDINRMMQDLLRESGIIKDYVLNHTDTPDFGPPEEAVIFCTIEEDVNFIVDTLLERVEEEIKLLDVTAMHIQPVCINYCLIGDKVMADNTHCSSCYVNERGPLLAKPHLPETRNLPKICVRKHYPRRKHHCLKSQDSILQSLEMDVSFLKKIYHEICEVTSKKLKREADVVVDDEPTPEETKDTKNNKITSKKVSTPNTNDTSSKQMLTTESKKQVSCEGSTHNDEEELELVTGFSQTGEFEEKEIIANEYNEDESGVEDLEEMLDTYNKYYTQTMLQSTSKDNDVHEKDGTSMIPSTSNDGSMFATSSSNAKDFRGKFGEEAERCVQATTSSNKDDEDFDGKIEEAIVTGGPVKHFSGSADLDKEYIDPNVFDTEDLNENLNKDKDHEMVGHDNDLPGTSDNHTEAMDRPPFSFMLKKSAKIADPTVLTNLNDYHKFNSSQDEIIEDSTHINSPIRAKESKYSNTSRNIHWTQESSSSDETVVRVKAMIQSREQASINLSNRAFGNCRLSVSNVSDSDYDADSDKSPMIDLPYIKYEYISVQELNNNEEIAYIEENVKTNDMLRTESVNDLSQKGKKPFIIQSVESLATSLSLESENSEEVLMGDFQAEK